MAVSKSLRMQILRRDNYTCQACGAKAPNVELEVDHVLAEALGGTDEASNLQTLCDPCNSGKAATPPDAATVAKVAGDAARWAQAIEAAAERMLAARESQAAEHAQFDQWWNAWTLAEGGAGGRAVHRDPGWQQSISRFLAMGLPLPILKDCLDIAMSRKKIRAADVWRYFCGIAWGKVRELQAAAAEAIRPEQDPSDEDYEPNFDHRLIPGRVSLANELLSWFQADAVEVLISEAREWYDDELFADFDPPPSDDQITIHAGLDAMSTSRWAVLSLTRAVSDLLESFSDQEIDTARNQAVAVLGDEIMSRPAQLRDAQYYGQLAHWLAVGHARSLMDGLSLEARAEWLGYVAACREPDPWGDSAPLSEDLQIKYVGVNIRLARSGYRHPRMCESRGEHIEACPRVASFRAYIVELDCCSVGDEPGHEGHRVCEQHLEQLVDGTYTNTKGTRFTVRDYRPIEGADTT
ncbi:hypothetical protein Aph01nite_43410 [Acrocarpospora phusangensis]|uniref:HNH nuclease domain-containing protein n=1 Tax=Acrocarpospora phusangensis TaxID=1070424 RepID=A0A919QDN4_9ACTN|nr:HNH endonuclease [Acrocarpospora phusangensis]GIH26031.1 hypothetical protein Aph01nite_43410 [Acrocarpospora phusangensis]